MLLPSSDVSGAVTCLVYARSYSVVVMDANITKHTKTSGWRTVQLCRYIPNSQELELLSIFSFFAEENWPTKQFNSHMHMQAYTPFTKPLENSTPLANRPFLLTLLLGKPFIPRQADLQGMFNSTEHLYEFLQLIEATFLHLSKAEGRLDLVLCTPRIGAIFSFSSRIISNQVSSKNLLLQVSPYYDIYMP